MNMDHTCSVIHERKIKNNCTGLIISPMKILLFSQIIDDQCLKESSKRIHVPDVGVGGIEKRKTRFKRMSCQFVEIKSGG